MCQVVVFVTWDTRSMFLCLAGSYKDNVGNLACTPCPAGKSSGSGQSSCLDCGVGKYSLSGAANCNDCPAGTYQYVKQSVSNVAPCTLCFEGRYSAAGSQSCTLQCIMPKGAFAPNVESVGRGATACSNCATGKYADINIAKTYIPVS